MGAILAYNTPVRAPLPDVEAIEDRRPPGLEYYNLAAGVVLALALLVRRDAWTYWRSPWLLAIVGAALIVGWFVYALRARDSARPAPKGVQLAVTPLIPVVLGIALPFLVGFGILHAFVRKRSLFTYGVHAMSALIALLFLDTFAAIATILDPGIGRVEKIVTLVLAPISLLPTLAAFPRLLLGSPKENRYFERFEPSKGRTAIAFATVVLAAIPMFAAAGGFCSLPFAIQAGLASSFGLIFVCKREIAKVREERPAHAREEDIMKGDAMSAAGFAWVVAFLVIGILVRS